MPPIDLPALLADPRVLLAFAAGIALVAAMAMSRVLRAIVRVAVSVALIALLVVLVQQRSGVDPVLGRLAAGLDLDRQRVAGGALRVPMAADGHFWVRATINGVPRRMLIDSGATVTAIAATTAADAGVAASPGIAPIVLRTANGMVRPAVGEIAELRMGNIVARDLAVVTSPAFGDVNVIGMNFLSRLQSWRVEGRTLILVPHHPQEHAAT